MAVKEAVRDWRGVTQRDKERVAKLKAKGYSRKQMAEALGISPQRVMYIVSLLPKKAVKREFYYRKERTTCTDCIPNPFPQWWCDKHNIDRNFYRPNYKEKHY